MVLPIFTEYGWIIVFHDCPGSHGYVIKAIKLLSVSEGLTIMLPKRQRHLFCYLTSEIFLSRNFPVLHLKKIDSRKKRLNLFVWVFLFTKRKLVVIQFFTGKRMEFLYFLR